MRLTPARFVNALILTIAAQAGFRPDAPVDQVAVEDAVLATFGEAGLGGLSEKQARRKIGLAFRSKRMGYVGKSAPLTVQKGRSQWALTAAGVEKAFDLMGTPKERLTILSMGLGRDSMTMLCLLVEGKLVAGGDVLKPADVDAVVFSDPGFEWQHSYDLIPTVKALCERHGIRFIVLAKPPEGGENGWRNYLATRVFGSRVTPPWVKAAAGLDSIEAKAAAGFYHWRAPLVHDYLRVSKITLRQSAACTDQHKITPINSRLMNDLCVEKFGIKTENGAWTREVAKGLRRQHRVLVGIAADETARIEKGAEARAYKARKFVMPLHPLVEMGIAKDDEGAVLARHSLAHVRKSGCMGCHWQPDAHWWALSVVEPEVFALYERMESEQNEDRVANGESVRYLRGSRPIREVVERWRARNPDADLQEVLDKTYDRCGKKAA